MAPAVRILTLLFCLWQGSGALVGQPSATESPEVVAQRPSLPGAGVASVPEGKPLPALPGTTPPAETLRELLAADPAERARVLSDYPESQRQQWQVSLREYEALTPEVREARLRQLNLRWHLRNLMRLAPDKRARRLGLVSPDLRPLVEERLQQWDLLPSSVQQDVLEHETTSGYFLRLRPSPSVPMTPQPEAAVAREPGASRWAVHLTEFFELPTREQEKTLQSLPPAEREKMEVTLSAFRDLPPEQRKICIDSFEKFNRMSPQERDRFLKSAARWKGMSPKERATWRTLVEILPPTPAVAHPPPLPPGAGVLQGPSTASNSATDPNTLP